MAQAGTTATGLDELARDIDALPREVELSLRAVAWRTSRRIVDRAREILNGRTGGKADRIAAFTIVENEAQHHFRVIAEGPADKPANLAGWFENGTRFMSAKPYLRPSADASEESYRDDAQQAAEAVVNRLGKG